HVTVAALSERKGRFLVVEECVNGKQVYNQPAGHLEDGESLVEAVVRETLEETRCLFTPHAVVGVYLWRIPDGEATFLRVSFCGEASDPNLSLGLDEGISRTAWLSRDGLAAEPARLRSPLVLRSIDDYL